MQKLIHKPNLIKGAITMKTTATIFAIITSIVVWGCQQGGSITSPSMEQSSSHNLRQIDSTMPVVALEGLICESGTGCTSKLEIDGFASYDLRPLVDSTSYDYIH